MTFDITKSWRWLVALGAVFVPAAVMGAVNVPFAFTSGTPIRAAEMNANFQALKTAIDGQGAVAPQTIGTLSLAGFTEVIPIRRFAHDLAIISSETGGGTARTEVGDLEVSCALGNSSPQLNLSLNQGTRIQTANLALGNLLIRLDGAQVTGVTVDGVVDGVPLQKLKLGFQSIEWTWQPAGQPARTASYNRVTNTGSGSADPSVQYAFFGAGVTPSASFIGITGYTSEQGCPTPGGAGGGTICRIDHSPLTVTKTEIGGHLLDDLSALTRVERLQTVELQWQVAGTGGATVVQSETNLEDVTVTSVKISTAPDGNLIESVGMDYVRIQWQVGSSVAGWDVVRNAPF